MKRKYPKLHELEGKPFTLVRELIDHQCNERELEVQQFILNILDNQRLTQEEIIDSCLAQQYSLIESIREHLRLCWLCKISSKDDKYHRR